MPNPDSYASLSRAPAFSDLARILEERVKRELGSHRARHVFSVRDYALRLADHFGIETGPVEIAALAHDLAREWGPGALRRRIREAGLEPSDDPVLDHGRVGALILHEEYGVDDPRVLSAVSHHTLGDPSLGPVGKILFVADFLEPGRPRSTKEMRAQVERLRLDDAVLYVIQKARESFGPPHPRTEAWHRELETHGAS